MPREMPRDSVANITAKFALLALLTFQGLLSAAASHASERDAVIETARKYLIHGLVEHNPERVPLANKCWRLEQGRNTGSSGPEIKQRLLREEYKVIAGISNERWLVEGNEATVFYDLNIHGAAEPVLIAERFKVVDGLIVEIEALIHQPGQPGQPRPPKAGIENPVKLSGDPDRSPDR